MIIIFANTIFISISKLSHVLVRYLFDLVNGYDLNCGVALTSKVYRTQHFLRIHFTKKIHFYSFYL